MKEAMFVHVGQSEHRLQHDTLDLLFRELLCPIFHELVNILLHIFKDEIEVVIHSNNFFKFDDLRVVKLAQRLNLSKGHAFFPRVELFFHLFDGDLFLRLDIYCFDDGAIGAISERLQNLVPLHLNFY